MYKDTGQLLQKLEIGLASSQEILNWAERYLPNGKRVGKVTSAKTVDYITLKPEPNGLFCQKIFGPVVDYTCACNASEEKSEKASKKKLTTDKKASKKKSEIDKKASEEKSEIDEKASEEILNKDKSLICPKCGVEKTTSDVRRYRLGYIQLNQPVIHSLYAAHKPSPIGLSLKWSSKRVQAVMYGIEFCHLSTVFKLFSSRNFLSTLIINNVKATASKSKLENKRNLVEFSKTQILFSYEKTKFWHRRFCTTREWDVQFWLRSIFVKELTGNKNQQTLPKLFHKFKNQHKIIHTIKQFYPWFNLNLGIHIYAVAYDMTWQEVEELQKFLTYLTEQPFLYENGIPYYDYGFMQILEKSIDDKNIQDYQNCPIQTGGFVFQQILSSLDLIGLLLQLRIHHTDLRNRLVFVRDIYESIIEKREPEMKKTWLTRLKVIEQAEINCLRRFKYIRDFFQTKTNPAWMVLSILPVLPPDLRPIHLIQGELVISDINNLYCKLVTRNKRVVDTTLIDMNILNSSLASSWSFWCYNLRQTQEAVDCLLKTGSTDEEKTTKSLLDLLKGKKGRFRQNLLGKRVDYSGRSVIVVGPKLKIHECGIPKQMAIKLFQPFLIVKVRNYLKKKNLPYKIKDAKWVISKRYLVIWKILEKIMQSHPILLNRAPTLHRLGIQAFLPKLVEGKAIVLHPLVCPAFNADFDGDQMAVHVPLFLPARAEAFNLLWSRNHILSPASGQPLLLPAQDMVLGCYYLTNSKEIIPNLSFIKNPELILIKYPEYYFSTFDEVQQSFNRQLLKTHFPIWIKWSGLIQNFISEHQAKIKDLPLECRLDSQGNSEVIFYDRVDLKNYQFSTKMSYLRTTAGRLSFHNYVATTISNHN